MRRSLVFLAFLCLAFTRVIYATPRLDTHLFNFKNNNLIVSGYVDGSYNYLLRSNRFISGKYDRVYDLEPNGFTLQQAAMSIAKRPEQGLGGLLDIVVGRDANQLAPNGINPNVFGIQNIGLMVPQAYIQYSYHSLTLKAGELLTLAGLELYDYTLDDNFSRSILDGYAQPNLHLGFRAIEKINDKFSLLAGVGNGWSTIRQPARQNTFELGLKFTVPEKFSVVVDEYNGPQYLTDKLSSGPTGRRNLLDIYGTLYLTKKLSVAANYDYGLQTKAALPNGTINRASWQGIAAYLNYSWTEQWLTSLRGETFNDAKGYRTGVRQNWRELTLTLAYLPLKDLQLRAETRRDFSNVNAFRAKSGVAHYNNQQSFVLEGLYKF